MSNMTKALVTLSGIAFLLAVIGNLFTGPMMGVHPEGFSRACGNLALIAIGVALAWKPGSSPQ